MKNVIHTDLSICVRIVGYLLGMSGQRRHEAGPSPLQSNKELRTEG